MNRSYYTIRVAGRLDSSWSDWFEGLAVRDEAEGAELPAAPPPGTGTGVTALSGWMDQSALHGTLAKIRDLGLPLLSVTRQEGEAGRSPGQEPACRRSCHDHGDTESIERSTVGE